MKPRNTLILLIITLGLFAFISFYESKRPTTSQKEYAKSHVADFNEDGIDGIFITNNEGKIELRRQQDNSWQVVLPVQDKEPIRDRADITLVHQLLQDLVDLKAVDSFDDDGKDASKPSLKELGLETSSVRVKLMGSGDPTEILFGKDTPVEGQMYVQARRLQHRGRGQQCREKRAP